MQKSFMTDYNADEKLSSFPDLNLSGKKIKVYIHSSLFVTILFMFKQCWQNISHNFRPVS